MARRDSFDDGHGMDHHRLHNALRVVGGAAIGAVGYGPIGAIAGAAAMHGANKYFDNREEENEEY
jgi:hypothetical protein